ncbi:MAG: hypothetical protein HY695_19355 [Deltaproteobacteria bacterium]|nr:hypothetical protein [Deltaproteobacteria bacterium]
MEKEGMPVAYITAMTSLAEQLGAKRIISGTKIPHPCGDPNLSEAADRALRLEIVQRALHALQTEVRDPTVFLPDITFTSG